MSDEAWDILLEISRRCQEESVSGMISVSAEGTVHLDEEAEEERLRISLREEDAGSTQSSTHFKCLTPFQLEMVSAPCFPVEEAAFYTLYLPYALLPFFHKKTGEVYTISHFAQTLDGKIATSNRDTSWIGNKENLLHAHRMRALCDAVVVGHKTNEIDNPRLTVREVSGTDPLRIVLGPEPPSTSQDSSEKLYLDMDLRSHNSGRTSAPQKEAMDELYDVLKKRGIKRVYLEGGAGTTAHFLMAGRLNQIQVHFSPKILGSGVTGFSFPGIEGMEDALTFKSHRFTPMGDEIMFIGEL